MLLFVLRRLALGVLVVLATAVFAYGGIRLLRPDLYAGEPWLSGTWRDVRDALLRQELGEACMYAGCPRLRDLWARGVVADLQLLAGGLVLGVAIGLAAGSWCAARARGRASRVVQAVALVFYCAPVYFVGYLLLFVFDPTFGLFPVPALFSPHQYDEAWSGVGDWLRSMTLPWLVVSAPIAAAALRITVGMARDAEDEEYVRTAIAKGLSPRRVTRRHATPAAHAAVASHVSAAVPAIVLNLVLVEFVLSVPGFFRHTWRAFGKAPGIPPTIDYPTLQAVAVWASVCIVVVGILADLALAARDPRVREVGRLG